MRRNGGLPDGRPARAVPALQAVFAALPPSIRPPSRPPFLLRKRGKRTATPGGRELKRHPSGSKPGRHPVAAAREQPPRRALFERTSRHPETGDRTGTGVVDQPQARRPAHRNRRVPETSMLPDGVDISVRARPARAAPNVNDPSAGSPTETLLRLLLSPSDRVRASSRRAGAGA